MLWFRHYGHRDNRRRHLGFLFFGNSGRNRSRCFIDCWMNRRGNRHCFRDRGCRSGGRFHLPLQFQQVAPQSVAHLHTQLGEFKESLAKLVLPPHQVDGHKRRGHGQHREHYEYELHERHSPVCT